MLAEIVFALASLSPDYLPADGRCLPLKEYPELAEVLHEGDNWPYGRCGNDGFRLPNLQGMVKIRPLDDTAKLPPSGAQPWIKVK